MRSLLIAFAYLVGLLLLIGIPIYVTQNKVKVVSPIASVKENPLEKYSFENLQKTNFKQEEIVFGNLVSKEEDNFKSRVFFFSIAGKKVSGVAHVPQKEGTYPIIVLLRGYIDQKEYKAGDGTKRVAEMLAKNGFIALAPDFLGYGQSASASASPIEERFQTYTTALTLLASLENINNGLKNKEPGIRADTNKIGIWGHSNGGQVALSILAISGKRYPTVLWAPVTKPFPYSVLYYTDEFPDKGKLLRKIIADFEKEYDAEKYTFTNYIKNINASMQLHQGERDSIVPRQWTDQFVEKLKELKKDVGYFTYPENDHYLLKNGGEVAVERSINFYKENFKIE